MKILEETEAKILDVLNKADNILNDESGRTNLFFEFFTEFINSYFYNL